MYGKFDGLDRLAQALIGLAALMALANGAFMLIDPFGWYDFVGTVKASGPPNAHFIRDIGIAFAISGLLLVYAALNPALRWGSAVVGNLFPTLHGVLHIYEVLVGICSPDIFWRDAPGVLGPAIAVWSAIGIQLARKRVSPVPLPKPLFVSVMQCMVGDAEPYYGDLSKAGGFAVEKFQHAMVLSGHYFHAPKDLIHMARLGSTRAEDCGPCVEIVRGIALADGMDAARLQNALVGKPESDSDALAYEFGAAIASGDAPVAAVLGDRIEALHDRKIRTELTLAAASGRLFPAIKRGLGYASACTIPRLAEHPL
ncbi:hypothetical protein G6N82_12900 [Altererythrobacter sp. BO-6]|uniref:hypothetical protein n=1 Tax=Altererythrobacter sp. BO-6 TaxID=2604537 RepID=UPI0013E1CDA4|nr:hypothetical protein [Altererythrobacter sp. BO-6]QIG54925.1 hypothetical protein G6N82_12900 [Altererythrobacter sp. BO-6]